MVRLRKVWIKGKATYVEVAPETCSAGHAALPKWGMCPHCTRMGRFWACREGCEPIYDCQYVGGAEPAD